MAPLIGIILFVLLVPVGHAGEWTIATFAGTGEPGFSGDGGPAAAARVSTPFGVVRGPDGAIWFCEYNGQRIRRVAPDGTLFIGDSEAHRVRVLRRCLTKPD